MKTKSAQNPMAAKLRCEIIADAVHAVSMNDAAQSSAFMSAVFMHMGGKNGEAFRRAFCKAMHANLLMTPYHNGFDALFRISGDPVARQRLPELYKSMELGLAEGKPKEVEKAADEIVEVIRLATSVKTETHNAPCSIPPRPPPKSRPPVLARPSILEPRLGVRTIKRS
jgi:hypothetical protein